jgi:hypothetical protein
MARKKKVTEPKKKEFFEAANKLFSDLPTLNEHFVKLKLQPVATLAEGFEKILSLWLNIVDFVNGKLKPFKNKYALINYSTKDKARRFFPIREAKAQGLTQLLVKMNF